MRAHEITNEVRLGKKDIKKGEAQSNLFTFGFEAEFIANITKENKIVYDFDYFDSYDKFQNVFQLSNKTINEIKTYLNNKNITLNDFLNNQGVGYFINILLSSEIANVRYHTEYLEKKVYIEQTDKNLRKISEYFTENLNKYIKVGSDTSYENYSLTVDDSIEDNKENQGAELISPIFYNYNNFLSDIEKTFETINKIGYTDSSTGLHVNIGFKNTQNINIVKLYLLLGDTYLTKLFGRETNSMAENSYMKLENYFKNNSLERFDTKEKAIKFITQKLEYIDKFSTINIQKLTNKGYLEFRIIGGNNYHNKLKEIKDIINRYLYVLTLSVDDELAKNDYLKKLAKLAVKFTSKNDIFNKYPSLENTLKISNISDEHKQSFISLFNNDLKSNYGHLIILQWIYLLPNLNDNIDTATKKLIKFVVDRGYKNYDEFYNEIEKYIPDFKEKVRL